MTTYSAKKIFIASPGDLNAERKIFIDVISEVNVIKAHSMGIHLEALGWEETLPGKGRPQDLINRDLVQSDLFVLLLWQRWGTPTGDYSSGTEEEFEVASKLNKVSAKPDMWVFFKAPQLAEVSENKDIVKIQHFRKHIEKQNSLLYKTFETSADWERLFRTSLCKWLDNMKTEKTAETTEIMVENQILIEISYLDWLDGKSRAEIYFTVIDNRSLEAWINLSEDNKKQFLYNQLSQHLYLTLGCNPYRAIMRYRLKDNQFILLGAISFEYGALIEESRIYIPKDLNQSFNQTEIETKLLDFWARI